MGKRSNHNRPITIGDKAIYYRSPEKKRATVLLNLPPTSTAEQQAERDAARVKAIKEKQRLEKAGRGQRKVVDHNLEWRKARKAASIKRRKEERAAARQE